MIVSPNVRTHASKKRSEIDEISALAIKTAIFFSRLRIRNQTNIAWLCYTHLINSFNKFAKNILFKVFGWFLVSTSASSADPLSSWTTNKKYWIILSKKEGLPNKLKVPSSIANQDLVKKNWDKSIFGRIFFSLKN